MCCHAREGGGVLERQGAIDSVYPHTPDSPETINQKEKGNFVSCETSARYPEWMTTTKN
jgi:hypothetical protein